jgi:AmiR/NasT family two-component response regulator
VLLDTLSKLGLEVHVCSESEVSSDLLASADIIFVDADEGSEPMFSSGRMPDAPIIAIVGSEAPSRLTRVVQVRAASHIQKPVRSSGVFTAVLLGVNEHAKRLRLAKDEAVLKRRLAGRRVVVKAVLALMRRWGIDEDAAYRQLRSDAMEARTPVEDAAAAVLKSHGDEPSEQRRRDTPDTT